MAQVWSGPGSGTEVSPYLIQTSGHLDQLRNYLGSSHADTYFKMEVDIDLTDYLNVHPDWGTAGWLPIGNDVNTFHCNLNGNGKKVIGLRIDRDIDYVGLFGCLGGDAEVINLGVHIDKNNFVKGNTQVGGLAGLSYGLIESCYTEGEVRGLNYVGGLVGMVYGGFE